MAKAKTPYAQTPKGVPAKKLAAKVPPQAASLGNDIPKMVPKQTGRSTGFSKGLSKPSLAKPHGRGKTDRVRTKK